MLCFLGAFSLRFNNARGLHRRGFAEIFAVLRKSSAKSNFFGEHGCAPIRENPFNLCHPYAIYTNFLVTDPRLEIGSSIVGAGGF